MGSKTRFIFWEFLQAAIIWAVLVFIFVAGSKMAEAVESPPGTGVDPGDLYRMEFYLLQPLRMGSLKLEHLLLDARIGHHTTTVAGTIAEAADGNRLLISGICEVRQDYIFCQINMVNLLLVINMSFDYEGTMEVCKLVENGCLGTVDIEATFVGEVKI